MRLSDLLVGTSATLPETGGIGDIRIAGVAADSRRVEPGFLFAALPGVARDGRAFIAEAVQRGAASCSRFFHSVGNDCAQSLRHASGTNSRTQICLGRSCFW